MTFGKTVKRLREKKGLSQAELARLAGMPLQTIAQQEQGRRQPTWPSVVRLARALGVSADDFSRCDEVKQ